MSQKRDQAEGTVNREEEAPADGEHELQGQGADRADRHAHGSGAGVATLHRGGAGRPHPPGIPRRPAPLPALGRHPADLARGVGGVPGGPRHRPCHGHPATLAGESGPGAYHPRLARSDQDGIGENHLQGDSPPPRPAAAPSRAAGPRRAGGAVVHPGRQACMGSAIAPCCCWASPGRYAVRSWSVSSGAIFSSRPPV